MNITESLITWPNPFWWINSFLMSIAPLLTDPSLCSRAWEPLGEISDILNSITENVISVHIIPCILQFSILEITSSLQYICLWRINLQSALSSRHRQTHISCACQGYQFLRPHCSLGRSVFCSPLSHVVREPTEDTLHRDVLLGIVLPPRCFGWFIFTCPCV